MSARCRDHGRRKLEASNGVSRICMYEATRSIQENAGFWIVGGSTAIDNHVVGGKEPGSKRHVLRLGSLSD